MQTTPRQVPKKKRLSSKGKSSRRRRSDSDDDNNDENGVIRCICDYDDDDGYMIQCDRCLVWQHSVCVGINQNNVPDRFFCSTCVPRPVDKKAANLAQKQQRLQQNRTRKEKRSRDDSPESDSNDVATPDRGESPYEESPSVTRTTSDGVESAGSANAKRSLSRDEKKIQRLMQSFQRLEENSKPRKRKNSVRSQDDVRESSSNKSKAMDSTVENGRSPTDSPADSPSRDHSLSPAAKMRRLSKSDPPFSELDSIRDFRQPLTDPVNSGPSTPILKGKKAWARSYMEKQQSLEREKELTSSGEPSSPKYFNMKKQMAQSFMKLEQERKLEVRFDPSIIKEEDIVSSPAALSVSESGTPARSASPASQSDGKAESQDAAFGDLSTPKAKMSLRDYYINKRKASTASNEEEVKEEVSSNGDQPKSRDEDTMETFESISPPPSSPPQSLPSQPLNSHTASMPVLSFTNPPGVA